MITRKWLFENSKFSFSKQNTPYELKITLLDSGKEIGWSEVQKGDAGLGGSAKRFFPNLVKNPEEVLRFYGINISKHYRGQGLGKQLMLETFRSLPGYWLANSQLGFPGEREAVYTIESLQKSGVIDLYWYSQKGGYFIARLR